MPVGLLNHVFFKWRWGSPIPLTYKKVPCYRKIEFAFETRIQVQIQVWVVNKYLCDLE